MGLDISSTAKAILDKYNENNFDTFFDEMTKILDNAFQQATPELANYAFTGAKGTLVFPKVTLPTGQTTITPASFGAGAAAYWSLAITPDTPQSCKNIDSVVNTASSIAPIITAGLMTITLSPIERNPPYEEFVKVFFDAVKTIVWTVTESDSDCNATLTGGAS